MRRRPSLPIIALAAASVWFALGVSRTDAAAPTMPGEVATLSWCSGAKDCLLWPAVPAAERYTVYRGGPAGFPALLSSAPDSCESGPFLTPTTGAALLD